MRLVNWRTLAIGVAGFGLAACGDDVTIPPTPITVTASPATVSCRVGDVVPINIAVSPTQGTATYSFTATPSPAGAFTVAQIGTSSAASITCSAAGTGFISGTAAGQNFTIPVSVQGRQNGGVISLTIVPSSITITPNAVQRLTATLVTEAGVAQGLTWTSQNDSIATVDANGNVRGVRQGITTVTVASVANPTVRAAAQVTVASANSVIAGITAQPAAIILEPTRTQQITANVTLASNAPAGTSTAATYTSSDTSIATVSATGLVTARRNGTAVITVASQAAPGVAQQVTVTVREPAPVRLTIQSVTALSGRVIDPATPVGTSQVVPGTAAGTPQDNLGTIVVTLNLDPGDFRPDSVEIQIGALRQTCQRYNTALAAALREALTTGAADVQSIVCPINLAQFDTLTGVPNIINGNRELTARVRYRSQSAAAGDASAQQTASVNRAFNVQNVNGALVRVTNTPSAAQAAVNAQGTAQDPTGRVFRAGSISVSVVSVTFSGPTQTGNNVRDSVVVTLREDGRFERTLRSAGAIAPTGAVTITFPGQPAFARADSAGVTGGNNARGLGATATPGNLDGITSGPAGTEVRVQEFATGTATNLTQIDVNGRPVAGVLFIDNQIPQDPDLYTVTGANFAVSNANNLVGFVNGQFGFGSGTANIVPRYNRGPVNGTTGTTAINGLTVTTDASLLGQTLNPDFGGVDRVTTAFFAGAPANATDLTTTTAGQRIQTPSGTTSNGLAATTTNTANNLAVTLTDALGNSRADLVGGTTSPLVLVPVGTTVTASTTIASLGTPLTGALTFGVDLQRPTISRSGGPSADTLSTGAPVTYTFASQDDIGFGPSSYRVEVIRTARVAGNNGNSQDIAVADPTLATLNTWCAASTNGGTVTFETDPNGSVFEPTNCGFVVNGGQVTFTNNGQYRLRIFVRDQAGNVSDTLSRSAVIDNTAPAVGGVSIPQTINGNQPATFTTSATDNLELARAYGQVSYGVAPIAGYGAGTFEFAFPENATQLGSPFDRVFTASAPAINVTIAQFVRSVLFTNAGTGIVPATTGTIASSLVAVAEDLVGLQGANRAFIPAANINQTGGLTAFNNNNATPNSINTFAFDVTDANQNGAFTTASTISLGNTSNTPTSLTFRIRQIGALNVFTSPFQRIELFASQVAGPAVYQRIGTLPNGFTSDEAGARTINATLPGFTFPTRFTNSVAATGTAIQYNVIAVGINASGDAVVSQPVVVTIVR